MSRLSPDVRIAEEPGLEPAAFIDLLERSGLAERRPVGDRPRIARMLAGADLILTARHGGDLVGISRAVTDFAYCCYLSDLAVDRAWQGQGIGRALMRATRDAARRDLAPDTVLRCLLLSAPAALGYYPHVGLRPLDNAFDFTDFI